VTNLPAVFFSAVFPAFRSFPLSLASRANEEKYIAFGARAKTFRIARVCCKASVLPANRFLGETGIVVVVVVVVSNNSQPSFLPVGSPLPASFYRAGRGIASAKIAAALHIRATLMRRGIGRSRPCRFLVTSKLQAIVSRKSGGSDVSEPRQDYGRRNIANGARARARAPRSHANREKLSAQR